MISSLFLLNKLDDYFIESTKIAIPNYFSGEVQILEDQELLTSDVSYFCDAEAMKFNEHVIAEAGTVIFICSYNKTIDLSVVPSNCIGILLSCPMVKAFNILSRYEKEHIKIVDTLNNLITSGANAHQFIIKLAELTDGDTLLIDNKDGILFTSNLKVNGKFQNTLSNNGQLPINVIDQLILKPERQREHVGITINRQYNTAIFSTTATSESGLNVSLLLEIPNTKRNDIYAIMNQVHIILENWIFSGSFENAARLNTSFQSIWDKLKNGSYMNDSEMQAAFKNLPHPIPGKICVATICFESYENIPYNYLLAKLRNLDKDINVAVENRDIILVLPNTIVKPGEKDLIFEKREDLNTLLSDFNAYMMYGNYTGRPNHTKEVFDLTRRALLIAWKINKSKQRVLFYEDYASYCIIDTAAQNFRNQDAYMLVNPVVLELFSYDKNNNENLSDVLFNYLVFERNVKKTAEEMHMHRNTVLNKLNRINQIVPLDLEDYKLRQRIIFSIQFIHYYKDVLNIPLPQKTPYRQ